LFHDGSELTADDIVWGVERAIANGRWTYMDLWEGIHKIDKYTFEFHYNEYNNQLIQNWAWLMPVSKSAYMEATGGDDEIGREWDRDHIVGCGPFKLAEYKRDSYMRWEKFEDYWQEGLPYLDEVFVQYIPDPVTARAMIEAGEGDYWMGAPTIDQLALFDLGFQEVSGWVGLVFSIWPNTSDPDSVWNDVNLRYALDYALDKEAIAEALGMGTYVPLFQLAPSTEWGYDPNYPERRYDPDKAKQLLADAGYPDGLQTTLLIGNTPQELDAGTAMKQYLDAVGIYTELDVADPGRFFGTVWGAAQPGLSYMWSGMDITNLLTYMRWFSTDPFTDLVYLGHTEEQAQMDQEILKIPDRAGQKAGCERAYKYLNDGAYLVPVLQVPSISVAAPYVHSDGPHQFEQGFVRFQYEIIYMDPH
jgi:ABC-type transport system substrate-binding protein